MKLRTRLFLFVGLLLLLICAAIFLVPVYVAEKQGAVDRAAYLARLDGTLAEVWEKTNNLVLSEIGELEGNLDALLYLVYNSSHVVKALENPRGAWLASAQLLAYSGWAQFAQLTRKRQLKACTYLTYFAHYWAYEEPINEHFSWVTFSTRRWRDPYTWATEWELAPEVERFTMLGVRLPSLEKMAQQPIAFQEAEVASYLRLLFSYRYLYDHPDAYKKLLEENKETLATLSLEDIPQAGELMENLLTDIISAQSYLHEKFANAEEMEAFVARRQEKVKGIKTVIPLERGAEATAPAGELTRVEEVARDRRLYRFVLRIMRRRVLDMIQGMGLFSSMGAVWDCPLETTAPAGAAYINQGTQQGGGVYATGVFSCQPLFDDGALLQDHPPVPGQVPISTGFGLIPVTRAGANTVVNTLELPGDESYLTLGIGLLNLRFELEAVTGHNTVVIYKGQVPFQTRPADDPMGDFFAGLPDVLDEVTGKTGFVTIGGEKYYYMRFQPNPEWDLAFATFASAAEVEEPYQVFEKRSDVLLQKITLWIFCVAIAVLATALIVLHFIARRFTRPIVKLAEATHHIVDGRYDEVDLPKAKETSKDEVSVLTNAFGKMVKGLIDRTKIRAVLDKVVSKEIAEEILKGAVELGGEVRTATVLFAEMGRHTPHVSELSPEEEVAFVNRYLNRMTRVIENHRGVIDKYVGDEIMALYGAPVFHEYAPLQSVISALLMVDALEALNNSIGIGIGINTGEMVAGNVGAEERLNYTVIGANVNLAARISAEAKAMEILIPKSMAEIPQIKQYIEVESYKSIEFKGFTEPVPIYRVVGVKTPHTFESISQMVSHA